MSKLNEYNVICDRDPGDECQFSGDLLFEPMCNTEYLNHVISDYIESTHPGLYNVTAQWNTEHNTLNITAKLRPAVEHIQLSFTVHPHQSEPTNEQRFNHAMKIVR